MPRHERVFAISGASFAMLISYLSAPSGFAINFFMDDLLQKIARDRDQQAFQELFRLYGPRIKAMMMRQGADAAASETLPKKRFS